MQVWTQSWDRFDQCNVLRGCRLVKLPVRVSENVLTIHGYIVKKIVYSSVSPELTSASFLKSSPLTVFSQTTVSESTFRLLKSEVFVHQKKVPNFTYDLLRFLVG